MKISTANAIEHLSAFDPLEERREWCSLVRKMHAKGGLPKTELDLLSHLTQKLGKTSGDVEEALAIVERARADEQWLSTEGERLLAESIAAKQRRDELLGGGRESEYQKRLAALELERKQVECACHVGSINEDAVKARRARLDRLRREHAALLGLEPEPEAADVAARDDA
jgi:hypothetical protein